MAKRVFFSFHYDDVVDFRANVVRNHHVTKDTGTAGFFDASIWEDAELHGDESVKRLIHRGLENTSVTCALVGTDTWQRRWVRYEILKSYDRGNALVGVHINSIPDKDHRTYARGQDPFARLGLSIDNQGKVQYHERSTPGGEWQVSRDLPAGERTFDRSSWGKGYTLSDWVRCHDWTADDGYRNFATWVENAK
jgi:hypothetical protein